MNDYKVNLFDIAYLSEEQVKLFKSDFRFVADYFVQMRMIGDYKGSHDEIKYINETMSLMAIMTHDDRFETALSDKSVSDGKEIKTMCEVLDRAEEKGRIAGRMEGRMEGQIAGELNANIAAAKNLQSMGMDISFISKALRVSEDVVKKWLGTQSA